MHEKMNPLVVSYSNFGDGESHAASTSVLGTEIVMNVGNFDVLLTGDNAYKLCLSQYSMHVGNNRFRVLMTMNAKQYEENAKLGEQSDPVVERIIDIVCRQVVPNGRFLVKNASNWIVLTRENAKVFVQRQLNAVIENSKPRRSVHDVFAPRAPSPIPLAHCNLAAQPVPASSSDYLQPSLGIPSIPIQIYNPSHYAMRSSEHSMLPACGNTSVMAFRHSMPYMVTSVDSSALRTNEEFLLALEPVPLGENIIIIDGDGEKKRRRRSSLLRRSASESILLTSASSAESFEFDNNKSFLEHSDVERAFSASSFFDLPEAEHQSLEKEDPFSDDDTKLRSGTTSQFIREKRRAGRRGLFSRVLKRSDSFEARRNNVVTTAEPLDVIFRNFERQSSSTLFSTRQHTGNNRLHVFMSMQMERYKASSPQEKRDMVLQMQETVRTHWGGRFLMETPEQGYRVLSIPDTVVMLLRAFDEKVGMTTLQTPIREPFHLGAVGGFQNDPPRIQVATSGNDIQVRNQALESLPKRKKRVGLASKIRKFAANTQTRLTRCRSEPSPKPTESIIDEATVHQFSSDSYF